MLLLRREAMSWLLLVHSTDLLASWLLNRLVIIVLCLLIWLLPFDAVILALNELIWIAVLPGEESSLSEALTSIINHSLLWGWAFTFGKMHDAFESIVLTNHSLLLILLLLLTCQNLLKLHLLLNFLLLIRQNGMLWCNLCSLVSYLLIAHNVHT